MWNGGANGFWPGSLHDVVTISYDVRRARPADGADFVRLVDELAAFEKLAPPDAGAKSRLLADAFSDPPKFELWVAERVGAHGLVAYAIVLWTYSSFLARPTLYIEDIYLSPEHRGTGLARKFMSVLAGEALGRGGGRIEGIVLGWNERARRFYRSTGATELDDWIVFRYDERALRSLAGANP